MQRFKINLLRLDYLFGAAIVLCQVSGKSAFTSLFFYGTFFISFLLWLSTLAEKVERLDILAFFICVIAFINVVINGLLEGASFSFEYFKKYIMFCCTVVFLAAAVKIEIESKTQTFLECLYICLGVFLIFMYFTQNRRMHILNGLYTSYLTFRFTNPNLTGLFLACMIMFLVHASFHKKRIMGKCLFFLVAAVDTFFLYQTQSRNSMLAVAAFLCCFLFVFLKKRCLVLKDWVLWLVAMVPLLFAIVYMEFVQNPVFAKMFSFIVSEGKDLDSRTVIWSKAFSAFLPSPVFGAYCQVSNGTGSFQLHNTHVDILISYGVVVLAMICVFLHGVLRSVQLKVCSREQSLSLIGFLCVILLGLGEAALFSGGLGIYLFAGVFLFVQKTEPEQLSLKR